jgi:hypothetical protein
LGSIPYSIGEPTDEEQYYLELINRARANPAGEGRILASTTDPDVTSAYQFFGVDLGMLVQEFDALAVVPPLSFNERLIQAARLHSGDMYTNEFQGHTGSDGSTLAQRLQRQGYAYSAAAENVYSYADSVFHGHAGFEVDWGPGMGGMQGPPRGHRVNIHHAGYREVGIGVVPGSKGDVGPQLVTQDFGSRSGLTPFATGVAYYDLDQDGVYDRGEGVGGLRIDLNNVTYYAVTAGSGGYSIPVPGNGTYTASFTAPGLQLPERTVTVSGGANVKFDVRMVYNAPAVQGPSAAAVNQSVAVSCSPVGAAVAYGWEWGTLTPLTATEGAENGLTTDLVASTTGSYSVVDTSVKASGTRSFHLAHPTFNDQTLELNRSLRPGLSGSLQLASRLGWAAPGQVARIQASADEGRTWSTLWSLEGTDGPGQTSFVTVTVSLAAYAGATVRVRFLYDYTGGSIYTDTGSGVGWYLDDIRFSDVEQLAGIALAETASTNFVFVPTAPANCAVRVQPKVGARWLPFGPAKTITVSGSLPFTAQIDSVQLTSLGQLQLECAVANFTPASVQLESRSSLASGWSASGLSPQVVVPGLRYRFVIPVGTEPKRYYRVRADP